MMLKNTDDRLIDRSNQAKHSDFYCKRGHVKSNMMHIYYENQPYF